MKKGIVRVLCGILAAQLTLSQGVYNVKAAEVTSQTAEEIIESSEDMQAVDSETEKETDTETDPETEEESGQTEKETDTKTDPETEGESGQTEKETDTETDPETEGESTQTEKETDTETNPETEGESVQTKKETDTETVLETEKELEQKEKNAAVYAEDPAETEEGEKQDQEEADELEETAVSCSTLTVTMHHASVLDRAQSFQVSLEGTEFEQNLILDPQNDQMENTVVFEDLDDGVYILRIEAPGFAAYEQQIVAEGYCYGVQIATGDSGNADAGLMPYGDLNQDGTVDKSDALVIVDALEAEETDAVYDLNGDGEVNLADLDTAVKWFSDVSYQPEEAKITKNVNPDSITGSVDESTTLDGDVAGLLSGESTVSLSPSEEGAVISAEYPVAISFDLAPGEKTVDLEGFVLQTPAENRIQTGQVEITYIENGQEAIGTVLIGTSRAARSANIIGTAETAANGQLTIKLNGQIAVKKVTIVITSMTQPDAALAEITSVEFINNMEDHIPAPVLDIPEVESVTAGNKTISVNWKGVTNVTGYQVLITLDGYTEYIDTTETSAEITMFRNKSLENKKTYTIAVQSVNGDWKSGYEQTYTATPRYDSIPDAPDSLKLESNYKTIYASWKAPKDDAADSYTLYYKTKDEESFQTVAGITSTSYTLYDLEDEAEYVIYVTAVNDYGEGPASLEASIQTKSIKPVVFSQYCIINSAGEEGERTAHIKSVTKRKDTLMNNSPLDADSETSALGIADNNFESYYQINDWDDAVAYHTGNEGWGLTVELDGTFKMNRFAIAAPDESISYSGAAIYHWEDGEKKRAEGLRLQQKKDVNGRIYYEITLSNPIETDKFQLGLQTSGNVRKIQVAEIRLYEYDSLADDIRALYTDDLYLAIRDDVTKEEFDALQERLDTKINGDYHPERDALQKELDAARQLFEEQSSFSDVQKIRTDISASYDSALKVSGLNAWQPLGVTAQAGDEVILYVGAENGKTGSASKLQLVVTQQHGESDQFMKTVNLNIGRNVITIPQIVSTDVEKGGALYVQYTGNNTNDQYAVRVNGGTKIPVLNLYGVTDETERQERVSAYVKELNEYCAELESSHDEDHGKKILLFTLDSYDQKTCIYNTTDIMLDHMMISAPAAQILAGLGDDKQAERMTSTVEAMDEMMELFYQHKGLTNEFSEGTDASVIQKNRIPSQHLNIRYMKMFSGAFMYASGNHIGVEWDSVKGLILTQKPSIDENGRLTSGSYFGWGIAHEIGHQINQGEYAIAEVTNNYFAVLAQADGTNSSVRFSYDDVYEKVTSGTTGYPSNVFTQLGMYWQLHLAYDSGFAQKTYATYQEMFDSLLFARVDTYARNPEAFNSTGPEVSLTLTGNQDQNLMRLVSAAAKKNLTAFFTRWGYVPDEETKSFMNQFEEETRAIYYIDDNSRTTVLEGSAADLAGQEVLAGVEVQTEHSDVTLKMNLKSEYEGQILGYEILRVTTQKGQTEKEIIGFTTENTFTDSVTLGSRAVSYEVLPVDLMTGKAASVTTETVKVLSDGNYEKSQFTADTNMTSDLDYIGEATEQDPCEPKKEPAVSMVLDQDKTKEYTGKADSDPYIVIDLKQTLEVSALRYYADANAISDYRIEVSTDGAEYMTAAKGTFTLEEGQDTVYFTNGTDPWVTTYDIRYIRITAEGQAGKEIGIQEFDILGPSGDNVEFTNDEGKTTIGILAEDYVYDQANGQKIPAGSTVFAGSYKGNPAYNVVVLYDQDGNIVGGTNEAGELAAQQIILAPDPEDALLGDVSDGIWIYWIEPDQSFTKPAQVKAELYRVDNALTNEGERLTSDTVYVDIPDQFEDIVIEE